MTLLRQIASALTGPQRGRDAQMTPRPCYHVQVVDRMTGMPCRVAGLPHGMLSRSPALAAADLMRNRDPHRFIAQIHTAAGGYA